MMPFPGKKLNQTSEEEKVKFNLVKNCEILNLIIFKS